MTKKITHSRLLSLVNYDPTTGIWRWLVQRNSHAGPVYPGDIAGWLNRGYRYIGIEGRTYKASRLAVFYVKKRWPRKHVDHESRVKDDDRFSNLRPANRSQNLQNMMAHKDNRSGVKGVSYDRARGKWAAKISVNRKGRWIGRFETKEDAAAAYLAVAASIHPFAPHKELAAVIP